LHSSFSDRHAQPPAADPSKNGSRGTEGGGGNGHQHQNCSICLAFWFQTPATSATLPIHKLALQPTIRICAQPQWFSLPAPLPLHRGPPMA
jgi:hypothetical protein